MNKNNVMINLNANIINTNTPIEKYKVQQKLIEYKKYINKKLNEFSKNKKNPRNTQIFAPINNKNQIKLNNKKKDAFSTCSVHYKRINKYFNKNNNRINDKNKRKISPYQNAKNIKLNFNSNSFNKIVTIKKNNNNSVNSIEKNKNKIINLTKNNNNEYCTNVKIKPKKIGNNININTNNNIASRSSSNNSKSSLNIAKNKNRKKFSQKPTLKNFVFTKS